MDRVHETAAIVADLNKYKNGSVSASEIVKSVCNYFDLIKEDTLTPSDIRFLKYISNSVGIPHYFDLLEKFNDKDRTISDFDLNTLSSVLYESTLQTDTNRKVHKFQKEVLQKFEKEKQNRYFLSASTSFGKTHLVYEIIKKMEYKNVILVFPTIALLGENLERIISEPEYVYFKNKFKVHTLSEVEEYGDRNLFIYTPERFLSFIERNDNTVSFDFAFIDEIYKIDNDYLIDDVARENERDIAYRLALFYTLLKNSDILLAGPYIEFSKEGTIAYNPSFNNFLSTNNFTLLDYNEYEIVSKSVKDIKNQSVVEIDENLSFEFDSTQKSKRLNSMVQAINLASENCIVYCSTKPGVESYAKKILNSGVLDQHDSSSYALFLKHIESRFKTDWVVVKALKKGIGIHHGLVPKYIQKEIIKLFNDGSIKVLISTTTITEGVNTSAKNLIVLHDKKGTKGLKKFDAKNISGRAGRFLHHYSGRVIVLQNKFQTILDEPTGGIRHKNYDLNSQKDEIDLYYTNQDFLSNEDKNKIANLKAEQEKRGIPDEIFQRFKVISRHDKLRIYDRIKALTTTEQTHIKSLISRINYSMDIHYDGFQTVLNVIEPIVRNEKMAFLIKNKPGNEFNSNSYSSLTHFVHYYLEGGFIRSLNYKINTQKKSVDKAMAETAEFVYNMLKYQVVKYVGVFNLMYRFYISQEENKTFDDVSGLDSLLIKLEYNALTEEGRIASDYGVPTSIIDYYEQPAMAAFHKGRFDEYEKGIFERVEKVINKGNNNSN